MQDDAVGSSAATLLTQLLLHLKSDMFKDSGQFSFYFSLCSPTILPRYLLQKAQTLVGASSVLVGAVPNLIVLPGASFAVIFLTSKTRAC